MRFTPCDCRTEHYGRVRRSPWMRLFASRRLYHCIACDQHLFIRPEQAGQDSFPDTVAEERPAPADAPGRSAA